MPAISEGMRTCRYRLSNHTFPIVVFGIPMKSSKISRWHMVEDNGSGSNPDGGAELQLPCISVRGISLAGRMWI